MAQPVNIWNELDHLERQSHVALAVALLKRARPSIKELARAALVSESAVAGWIKTVNRQFPKGRA